MTPSRRALVAATATTVLWAAKALAIAVAGGLGRSPLEGPLFLLGLLAAVVTSVLLGIAAVQARGVGRRVLSGLAGLVAASVYGTLEGALVAAVQPAHPAWVWGEVNLWVLGLTLLVAGLVLDRRAPVLAPAAVPA